MHEKKRITIIVGHYGSGKTEFSVNYAFELKKSYSNVALIDLDIINPYFRSREKQALLEKAGISVYSNSYGYDIAEDIPALSSSMKGPLQNKSYITVIDVGGDDNGARVLQQLKKYLDANEINMLCVINANRPETSTLEGALKHINAIEEETGMKINGLISNTHLLKETSTQDIMEGINLCEKISNSLHIPIYCSCCKKELKEELEKNLEKQKKHIEIFEISKFYMRENWMK